MTRISGDDHDGTYQLTGTLPYGSKQGVWELGDEGPLAIGVNDRLGNQRLYVNDLDYANAYGYDYYDNIPDITKTFVNTAESSSVTIQRSWTLSSSTASVTFPANTVVTKQEGGSFAFYQMVNQGFEISDVTTDGLSDGTVVVGKVKIGIPGLNLSFSKPVTVSLTVDGTYNDKTLSIEALTEGAENWANETSCTVSDGQCSFTVSHASYFVAIVHGSGTGVTDGTVSISTGNGADTGTILNYSTKKSAKKKLYFTLNGVSLKKKNYVTIRLGGKKVKVVSAKRSGNGTRIGISFKYRKWTRGNYNLSLSYKVKNNKHWSKGSFSQSDFLSII